MKNCSAENYVQLAQFTVPNDHRREALGLVEVSFLILLKNSHKCQSCDSYMYIRSSLKPGLRP